MVVKKRKAAKGATITLVLSFWILVFSTSGVISVNFGSIL